MIGMSAAPVRTRASRFFGTRGWEEAALGKGESAMGSYVLVVEHHETHRRQVGRLLAEHGYESRVVSSCRDALTSLRLGPPPAVIVIGPTVPSADTEELRALTRRQAFLARIPIAVLSARATVPATGADFTSGSADFDECAWIEAASRTERNVP
jgi:DNA-binding NtrC family response regulator